MEKIRCVITDDEPIAIKGLVKYVDKIDFLELVGTTTNGLELNTFLNSNVVDLIFVDIQMPLITGVELVKSLKNPPLVVFTTAFEKYALEGYSLDVLDYLLKPIAFERFLKAANKARQYFSMQNQTDQKTDYFFIKAEQKLEKINISDILHIEAMQNYLRIFTAKDEFLTHMTLKSILEYLDTKQFAQTHKSHVVAINKIQTISGNQILIGDHIIPISKRMKEDVLEKIVNSKLLKG